MSRRTLFTRPSISALIVAAPVLVLCSLARVAGQPLVDQAPVVAVILTFLVFLIPGAVVGVLAPRSFFWDGAILGIIGAFFATLQSLQFSHPNWSSIILYEAIGVLACLSIPLCLLGALGGRTVSWRRQSSNQRFGGIDISRRK